MLTERNFPELSITKNDLKFINKLLRNVFIHCEFVYDFDWEHFVLVVPFLQILKRNYFYILLVLYGIGDCLDELFYLLGLDLCCPFEARPDVLEPFFQGFYFIWRVQVRINLIRCLVILYGAFIVLEMTLCTGPVKEQIWVSVLEVFLLNITWITA